MTINDSERYLRLMLGGMKYAVRYWKDRDKEESDIEQTNIEAVKTALDTMSKYQRIQAIINNAKDSDGAVKYNWLYEQIREVVEDATN